MSKLVDWLVLASEELGLVVEVDFSIAVLNGAVLKCAVKISNIGAQKGMLIFSNYLDIKGFERELVEAGYAYSVMDEPLDAEKFDLDSFRELFLDWGWSGEIAAMPNWMASTARNA